MHAIDYSALSSPVTAQDVRVFRRNATLAGVASGSVSLAVWSALFFAAAVLIVSVALLPFVDFGDGFISPAILFGLVELGIVTIFIERLVTMHKRWKRMLRLSRFSHANGLEFLETGSTPAYPGMIFNIGSERHVFEQIVRKSGPFFDFGNITYNTGSGKSRQVHTWSYIALKLNRMLPQIVLDAKSNNRLFTNLPTSFSRKQVLPLEGDFDRHFTLYCPTQYEADALYVFTPDLMACLIDDASEFDVEIVDDWMFFYASPHFDFADQAHLSHVFNVIETVGQKAVDQTELYSDSNVEHSTGSTANGYSLNSRMAVNTVAPQGRRLRKGVPVLATIIVTVMVGVWLFNFAPLFMAR